MANPSATITVVTSYYNDQDFLADAIASVLAQTYTNFEYILINHASTDNSRQIAHSFADARIKHIDLPFNYGGSGNILLQHALNQASGEYIKLLNADDILLPDGLEKLYRLSQITQADLIFGNVQFIRADKTPTGKDWFTHQYPANLSTAEYLRYYMQGVPCLPYAGNFIRTQKLREIDLDYVSIQVADLGIWVEILLNGGKLACSTDIVAQYRIHDGQSCSASNLDIIGLRCQFEHILYYRHFFCKNIPLQLLKDLFPDTKYIAKLTDKDRDLFPFAMALALYRTVKKTTFRLACRQELAYWLNQLPSQHRIEQLFGYTIKDLREDIVQEPILLVPFTYTLEQKSQVNSRTGKLYRFTRRIFCKTLAVVWKWKRALKKLAPTNATDDFV